MNSKLKNAVDKKLMLHNKYKHHKNSETWEMFRKQRNLVTKIKREFVKNYFIERCIGGPKSKDFWMKLISF